MKTEPNEPITAVTEIQTTYIGRSECSAPVFHIGLTKREYFADMALTGMLAYTPERDLEHAATLAAKQADALISALNR